MEQLGRLQGGNPSASASVGRGGLGELTKPCISRATTMVASFAEDVEAFAGAGFRAMEVWLTKLETHLESHSLAETRRLLEDQQMTLAAAAYQGGLLLSQGEQRREQQSPLISGGS